MLYTNISLGTGTFDSRPLQGMEQVKSVIHSMTQKEMSILRSPSKFSGLCFDSKSGICYFPVAYRFSVLLQLGHISFFSLRNEIVVS